MSRVQDVPEWEEIASEYYKLAKEFCVFVQNTEINDNTIARLIIYLMELYSKGLRLPNPDLNDENAQADVESGKHRIQGKFAYPDTYYWQFFNPFIQDDPVCGSLYDDLGDITADIIKGIKEYESGRINRAVFSWTWTLTHHAGYHIVNALRALHFLSVHWTWDKSLNDDLQ